MCARVAASIVEATGVQGMVVNSEREYEDKAVELATSVKYVYVDRGSRALEPGLGSPTNAGELRANSSATSAQPHGSGSAVGNSQGQGVLSSTSSATQSQVSEVVDKSVSAWGAAPPRSSLLIAAGPSAPPGAVSRLSSGSLSALRRSLFLTRERSSLFDTRGWVRALERGYEEAWRRWVAGTDQEDTEEWERLDSTAKEKRSGHIWLTREDMK